MAALPALPVDGHGQPLFPFLGNKNLIEAMVADHGIIRHGSMVTFNITNMCRCFHPTPTIESSYNNGWGKIEQEHEYLARLDLIAQVVAYVLTTESPSAFAFIELPYQIGPTANRERNKRAYEHLIIKMSQHYKAHTGKVLPIDFSLRGGEKGKGLLYAARYNVTSQDFITSQNGSLLINDINMILAGSAGEVNLFELVDPHMPNDQIKIAVIHLRWRDVDSLDPQIKTDALEARRRDEAVIALLLKEGFCVIGDCNRDAVSLYEHPTIQPLLAGAHVNSLSQTYIPGVASTAPGGPSKAPGFTYPNVDIILVSKNANLSFPGLQSAQFKRSPFIFPSGYTPKLAPLLSPAKALTFTPALPTAYAFPVVPEQEKLYEEKIRLESQLNRLHTKLTGLRGVDPQTKIKMVQDISAKHAQNGKILRERYEESKASHEATQNHSLHLEKELKKQKKDYESLVLQEMAMSDQAQAIEHHIKQSGLDSEGIERTTIFINGYQEARNAALQMGVVLADSSKIVECRSWLANQDAKKRELESWVKSREALQTSIQASSQKRSVLTTLISVKDNEIDKVYQEEGRLAQVLSSHNQAVKDHQDQQEALDDQYSQLLNDKDKSRDLRAKTLGGLDLELIKMQHRYTEVCQALGIQEKDINPAMRIGGRP
jgi:hypothetical protein